MPLFELARVDSHRHSRDAVGDAELDGGDAPEAAPADSPARRSARGSSGTRRSSPPAAGARDPAGRRSSAPARRRRQSSAPTIQRCRRRRATRRGWVKGRGCARAIVPPPAAGRRRDRWLPSELRTSGRRASDPSGVDRSAARPRRPSRASISHVRAQADRRVHRRRALVERGRAARCRWCRRLDRCGSERTQSVARAIIQSSVVSLESSASNLKSEIQNLKSPSPP